MNGEPITRATRYERGTPTFSLPGLGHGRQRPSSSRQNQNGRFPHARTAIGVAHFDFVTCRKRALNSPRGAVVFQPSRSLDDDKKANKFEHLFFRKEALSLSFSLSVISFLRQHLIVSAFGKPCGPGKISSAAAKRTRRSLLCISDPIPLR